MSPVNSSITTGNVDSTAPFVVVNDASNPELPLTSIENKKPTASQDQLPIAVKNEIGGEIGQSILEYADRKEIFYPDYSSVSSLTYFI